MTQMISIENVGKTFTLHTQGSATIPVFDNVTLAVEPGECVVLDGPSGIGKSSLLRMIYANYRCLDGRISVRHDGSPIDIAEASPRTVLDIRRRTMGYVSQFLRVIPRVSTLSIVGEPLRSLGVDKAEADAKAMALLARLGIPEPLWQLSPVTFSGGEKQRVNIARGFIAGYPVMLLDEPTASLDAANTATVIELIQEAKAQGTAILGIFHDTAVRNAVATRHFDMRDCHVAA